MSYTGNIKIYGKTIQSSNQVPSINVQANDIRVVSSGSSKIIGNAAQRKQVVDGKRLGILERTQVEEVYPPVVIHRVDSSEHRQKVRHDEVSSSYNQNLTNSLYSRPNMAYIRSEARNMSTSVDKTGSGNYLTPKFNNHSSNQSDTNRASYKLNVPTYKNEGNNLVTYGNDSETGSNDGQYKAAGYVNQRLDNLGISNRMVSSIISRQSNQKLEGSYPLKSKQSQVYQLYSSRHPNQSIRRSTIQISKAMSQNAIAQLERQNEHKEKKIKKLEKEKEHYQSNTQKWEDIKHRYQMDLESKSRQIIDLQRANKRLVEEVQGIRAYRTMDTVEQVIIVRLKQQIMQLNKKIIEMRTEHYRNQQQLIEKHQKKQAMVKSKIETELTDKQKLKKLQGQFENKIKQIQFLGVELQKQKQKSWSLLKERQQFSAEIATSKQALEKQSSYLKKQVITLKQEVQEKFEAVRSKDFQIEDMKRNNDEQIRKNNERAAQQLEEQKRSYQNQINSKIIEIQKITEQLSQKQKQAEQKIQEQKQTLQRQLAEQSKKTESKVAQEQQNKQLLQRLRQEKEQNEQQLKSKIAEMEQNLRNTNQRISQKDQQLFSILNKDKDMQRVIGQYQTEVEHLKRIIGENETFFRELQNENQMIKAAINERNVQIEHLRIDNMHIVQNLNREIAEKQNIIGQQVSKSQSMIKNRIQAQFKQKQRQLEVKLAQFNSLQQNVKQEKQRIEQQQQQQQQSARLQAEQKERQKQENQKWRAQEMGRIQNTIRSKLETQFKQKQRQLQSRIASVNNLQKNVQQEQKNIKQLQSKIEQEKQVQLQQQLALQQKNQSESRDRDLKQRQKWRQDQFVRMQVQIKSHLEGVFGQKQQQLLNQIGWLEQNLKELQFRFEEQQRQIHDQVQNEQRIQQQRINNQKWKQQEILRLQTQIRIHLQKQIRNQLSIQIRTQLQGQLKQKEKQLQTKLASVNLMEQNLKQVKTKALQQQKGQVQKEQASIKELQIKRNSLTEQVKKLEAALGTVNRETAQISSKKTQLQSQLGLKQRQLQEIEAKNSEIRVQLQASLLQVSNLQNQKRQIGGQIQRLREAQNVQKEFYNKQQQAKYNSLVQQVNSVRGEYSKLQQLFKQNESQLQRRIEIENALKSKTENLQANSNLLKSNLANLQNQREEFKKKIKQHEDSKASRMETMKKYEQLLPEFELLKQKLKLRQDQITGRQTAYTKLKQYTDSTETKVAALSKQLRNIQTKIDENQAKFRVLINKTEQQQFQYKSLYEKMVNDTQTYVEFIKELQQQNEFLAQKYWKVRKLVRKQKLTEDHQIPERREYGVFYKFLENQLSNHFSKVIFPAFKSKMSQKISEIDSRLITQYRKIMQAKSQVQYGKRRRAAERARSVR